MTDDTGTAAYTAMHLARELAYEDANEQARRRYGSRMDGGYYSDSVRRSFARLADNLGYIVREKPITRKSSKKKDAA